MSTPGNSSAQSSTSGHLSPKVHHNIPILPSPQPGHDTSTHEPMDVSPTDSPVTNGSNSTGVQNGAVNPPASAAAAVQHPKIVQTAFIHKLYNMLEDQSIQHLISWSSSNESFLISPSTQFSKVLASYFKHTNVSSFVRQLNMYGFHKVSDVFHSASPDSPLWEFKHGNGNFKRGDLDGLREIKRRASRQTLIHRDATFSVPTKPVHSPQAPTTETIPPSTEARLSILENNLYDVSARLNRAEDINASITLRNQALADGLTRSYQYHQDLSNVIVSLLPANDHSLKRDISLMQKDMSSQLEIIRSTDRVLTPPRSLPPFNGQLSPSQLPLDSSRRSSASMSSHTNHFRRLEPSPRRLGSIGAITQMDSSPSSLRNLAPPLRMPPPSAPSNTPQSYNFARRHTSADIRTPNWPQEHNGAPALPPLGNYPSPHTLSPISRGQAQDSHSDLRASLANYSLSSNNVSNTSRPSSPPAPDQWSLPPAIRVPFKHDMFRSQNSSGAPTRRGSLANIHTLLNPAETVEVPEGEGSDMDPNGENEEARKRKRIA